MKNSNKKNFFFLRRDYNFLSRVSNSSVIKSSMVSVTEGSVSEDIENLGLTKPEVTKA